MMEKNPDRLYELLPYIYRLRDSEQGYALQALLRVIAEQVNLVEADIDRLYDNWFIETCEDWLVPYIGDLVGYRLLNEAGEPGAASPTERERQRSRILIPRRDVANTIRYRRRKGTLALLELLARDVAGWPARAVEFYTLLAGRPSINHLEAGRSRMADLRQGLDLGNAHGPFDCLAHLGEVRRINSALGSIGQGRYNVPSVGVFVWRLKVYSVTRTQARCLEEINPRFYSFSVLGNNTPLYNHPTPETAPEQIASELNLPTPILRRPFEDRSEMPPEPYAQASADYYGTPEDPKSMLIWAPNWPYPDAPQPLPRSAVIPVNLDEWQYNAPDDRVLVDPELGRIVFPQHQLPPGGVRVSYYYAFSDDIGGGEYPRPLSQPEGAQVIQVATLAELVDALRPWKQHGDLANQPAHAVVEITRSGEYSVNLNLQILEDHSLQIRAASGVRPVLRLGDVEIDAPDAFSVTGEPGSRLVLDGLLITGRGVRVIGPKYDKKKVKAGTTTLPDDLCHLVIRHCTLVPGWKLDVECDPVRPNEASLWLDDTGARVTVEHSILGSIYVVADAVRREPLQISLSDSILDATGFDCEQPGCVALAMPGSRLRNWRMAHAVLKIERCTVFGRIYAHAVERAENSIFMGPLRVARRQYGCVRFCYLAPGSRTPPRFRCQPDLVEAEVNASGLAGPALEQELEDERLRVRPQFNSTRYGTPTYAQLAHTCAEEIRAGADDQSEMGVFHDLYQPQRLANLQRRLDEYTPAGMDAGVIYAN